MKKLWEIPLTFRIDYSTEFSNVDSWPLVRILFNNNLIINFEADSDFVEFTVLQDIELPTSKLVVEHYGKNYHKDQKFFQIDNLYINNINLENILWDGIQYPLLPPWESNAPIQKGNMHLGHNGTIEWEFNNPILLDIQKRLGKTVNQISGQDTTYKVLNEVKEYFFNIK